LPCLISCGVAMPSSWVVLLCLADAVLRLARAPPIRPARGGIANKATIPATVMIISFTPTPSCRGGELGNQDEVTPR